MFEVIPECGGDEFSEHEFICIEDDLALEAFERSSWNGRLFGERHTRRVGVSLVQLRYDSQALFAPDVLERLV